MVSKTVTPVSVLLFALFVLGLGLMHNQERSMLELRRINTNLENIYNEMPWADETWEAYCAENPEDCEVLE